MAALSQVVGRAFYGRFAGLRPAQRDAIEPILRGEDVLVLSRTGSGKTEAVIAPLVQRYGPSAREASGCSLLHVTPTRALANDLLRRVEPPMDSLGYTVGIRHGDRNDLARSRSPDLLITTPESLDVMLTSGENSLRTVRAVILDEVHLTYNTQRGLQLAVLLKRLERFAGHSLQVAGLSATVASPSDIWAFFRPGRPFATIQEPEGKPIDYHICEAATPADLITLLDRLASGRRTKALLFANSRRECDSLASEVVHRTGFGDRVFLHHSSLSRDIRLRVERSFQEAGTALCIATSTLELGIDIGDIDVVVLYGHPGGWESFLQRIGRGNRRSDKTNVVCVASPHHGAPFVTVAGFEALVSQVESGRMERERPVDIYGAAAQQLLSLLLGGGGAYQRIADLVDFFADWPHLSRPVIEQTLLGLAEDGYVRAHSFQNKYGAGENLHRLHQLRLIWGNFPTRSRDVRVMVANRELGVIPATNLLRLLPGMSMRFAGRFWRVRRVRPEIIEVEPSRQRSGVEVIYSGSKAPLDPTNVEEMLRILESGISGNAIASGTREWFLGKARAVRRYVGWDRIPTSRDGLGYHYFTFAGQVVNGAIARWSGSPSFEAGEIELVTEQAIDFSALPEDASELEPFACQTLRLPESLTIFQLALPPELLERELAEIWRKTPVFQRSLSRLRDARVLPAPIDDLQELRA